MSIVTFGQKCEYSHITMKCDHSHIQRHCRACALPAVGAAVSLNGQISCAACSLRVRFCSRREHRVTFSRVYLAARFSFLVLLVTFTPARIGLSLQALVFLFSNLTSFSACSHELSTVHQNFANFSRRIYIKSSRRSPKLASRFPAEDYRKPYLLVMAVSPWCYVVERTR